MCDFRRLYYQYRPQYYYWTVVVLCRKFMIALTSLMFNRNPAFQLAMALLTLFICYSLQVRCTPYMSMSERSQVLQEHQRRVQAGVRQNMALEATLNSVRRGWKKAAGSAHMDKQLQLARQPVVSFFWNYNTVESVLLFSAVLVNLAGIMFQSGQLNTEGYETEKAFVTWVIVLVIVASIIYFFTVLFSEIYTMCTANSKKRLEKAMEEAKKQVELSRRKGMAMGEEKKGGGGDEAALNPLFVQMMRSTEEASDGSTLKSLIQGPPPSTGQWAGVVAGVEQLFATNQTLAEELAAIKKEVQTLKTITRSGSFRAPLPATGSSSPSSDHAAAARAPNRRLSTTTKRSFAPSSPLLHPNPQPPSPTINPLSLRLSET